MAKDIHRYSHSRISTFKQCPLKHHYAYVEQIETPETSATIPGKLFHECVELTLKKQDITPVLNEFKKLCLSGKLEFEPDLLEYVVSQYFNYYKKDYATENTVLIEKEFTESLEEEDYLTLIVDQAYTQGDYLVVRDMKTTQNKLKYTQEDVQFNQQLLLYLPFVEDYLKLKVNAIQIDEIRLAKLQPVPLRYNGKPSTDKNLLQLVTYENYYDTLASMGLESEKEYKNILEWLQQRGHPLFNRVTIQILDEQIVTNNAIDIVNTYKTIKNLIKVYDKSKKNPSYRVKGPLCKYCSYKELCQLDYLSPSYASREIIINKIQKN